MTTNDTPNSGNRSVLVQTTLRVSETGEDIEVVSDRGIQTIATAFPTNDNQSFIPFLEFTPYSEIVKDSQKVLDLPRKAALQFNLERHTQKRSLSDINPKSALKKSMSNTTLAESETLHSQHTVQTMSKTKEEREIQTDLTVNPYILDEDTVANVCTQLSVQTSITFEPSDSLAEITQALKKAIVHTKNCQAVVVDGKLVTDYKDPNIEQASRVTVSERLSRMDDKPEHSNISKKNLEPQDEDETLINVEEASPSPSQPVTHTIETSVPVPLNMTEEEFEANVQRILDQTVRNVYEFMAKIVEMYEQSKDADGKYVETPLSKELRKQAMAPQRLFPTVDEADEEAEVSEAAAVKEESESLEKKPPPLTRTQAAEDDANEDPTEPKTPVAQKQPSALETVAGLIRGPKWYIQQALNVDVKTGLPTPSKQGQQQQQQQGKDESIDMGEEFDFDTSGATIEFVPMDVDEAEKHFTQKTEPPVQSETGAVDDALKDTGPVESQEQEESAAQEISTEQEKPQAEEVVGDEDVPSTVDEQNQDTTDATPQDNPEAEDITGDENVPSTIDEENQDATDATPQEKPQDEDIVGDGNLPSPIDEESQQVTDTTPQEAAEDDDTTIDATAEEPPKEGDEAVAEVPEGQQVVETAERPPSATDVERPDTPPPSLIDIVESIGDSKVKPDSDIPCECSRIHEAGAAPPSISQPAIKFEVKVLSDARRKGEGAEGVIVQASLSRPEHDHGTCTDMNINFSVTVGGQTFTPGDQLAIEGASEIDIESCTCKEEQEKPTLVHEKSQGSLPGTSDDFEECVCHVDEEDKPATEEVAANEEFKEETDIERDEKSEGEAETEPVTEEHTETPTEPPDDEADAPTESETEPLKQEAEIPTEEGTESLKEEVEPPTETQPDVSRHTSKQSVPSWKECKCGKLEGKPSTNVETQTETEADRPPAEPNEKDVASTKHSVGSSFAECICTESEIQSVAAVNQAAEKVSTKSEAESFAECICTASEMRPSAVGSGKQSKVTISAPPSKQTAKPSGDQVVGKPEESEKPSEMEIRPPTEYPEQSELSIKEGSQKIKQESHEFLECGCRKTKSTSTIKKTVCICEDKNKTVKKESQEFLECGCRKQRSISSVKKPVCTCADKVKPVPQESQEFLECGCKKQRPPSSIKKPVCSCADGNKPALKESQEFFECGCRKRRPASPVKKPVCTCADNVQPTPKELQEVLECGCKKIRPPSPPQKSVLKDSREVLECRCKTKRPPSPPKEPVCTCKSKVEDVPLKPLPPAQKVCGCQAEQFSEEQLQEFQKFQSEPVQRQALADVGTCMGGDGQAPCKQQSAPLRTNDYLPHEVNQTFSLPTQNVSVNRDAVEPATQKGICICPQPGKYDESIEEYVKKLISESITTRDPELIQTHAACIGPFLQKFAGKLGQQAEGVSGRPIKCTGDAEQQCSCSVQILYVNDGSQPTDTAEKACTCAIPKEQTMQKQEAVEPAVAKSCHCDMDNEPSPNLECMYEEDNDYSEMYMEELQGGDGFRLDKIESDKVLCECPEELPPVLVETDKCTSNIEIPWLSIALPPPGTIVIKPTREVKKKVCDCWDLDLKDSVLSATEPPIDDEVEQKPISPPKSPSKQSTQSKSSSKKSLPKSPKPSSKQSTPPKSPSKQSSPPKSPSNQSKPTEETESPEQLQETAASEEQNLSEQPPDTAEPGESELPQPPPGESEQAEPPPEQSEQPEHIAEEGEILEPPTSEEETSEPPKHLRPPEDSSSGCSCIDTEADECADEQLGDMHFVYDNPCFANCEPYMDPVYKLYPDDCDTYCGPFTEIHWSEILIPKKVKLRGITKTKPSPPTGGQPSPFAGSEPQRQADHEKQIGPPQSGPQTGDAPASELEINIGFTQIASTFIKVEGGADSQVTVSEMSTISDLRMQIKRCPKEYGVTLYMPTVGSQPFIAADNGPDKIAGLMVAVEPFSGPMESQPVTRMNTQLDNIPKSASMPNMSISTLDSTEFRDTYPRAMNRPIAADYYPQGQKQVTKSPMRTRGEEEEVLAIQDLSTPAKLSQTATPAAATAAFGTKNPPCNVCGRKAPQKPDPQPDPTPEAKPENIDEEHTLVPDAEQSGTGPIASETSYMCQPCKTYLPPEGNHPIAGMQNSVPKADYGNLSRFTVKSDDFRKQYGIPPPKYEDPQCAGLYTFAVPQMEERTSNISAIMAQNREIATRESTSSPGIKGPPAGITEIPHEPQQKDSLPFPVELAEDIGEKRVCKSTCRAKIKSEQQPEQKKPCSASCQKQHKEEPKLEESKIEPIESKKMPIEQSKTPCTGPCAHVSRDIINIQEITDKEMKSINDEIEKIKRKLQDMHIPELDNWKNIETCPCMQDYHRPQHPAHFAGPQQFPASPYMYPTAQYPGQYPYNMPDYSMYTNVPSYSYPCFQSDGTEGMDYMCSCSRKRPTTRRQKKRRRNSSQSTISDISSVSGASKRSRASRSSRGSRSSKSSKGSGGSASSKGHKKRKRRHSSQTTVSGISSVSAGSGRSSKGSVSVGELTSYKGKSDKSTSQVSFQDTSCSTQTDTEPEVEIRVGKGPPRIRTKQNFKGFVSKDPHKNRFRVAVRITPSKLGMSHRQDNTDESSGYSQT